MANAGCIEERLSFGQRVVQIDAEAASDLKRKDVPIAGDSKQYGVFCPLCVGIGERDQEQGNSGPYLYFERWE